MRLLRVRGRSRSNSCADLNGASSVDLVVAAIQKAGKAEGGAINTALKADVETPSVTLAP